MKPRSIILPCSQYFSTCCIWIQLGQPTNYIIKTIDCELGRGPVSKKCILAPWLRKEKIGQISAPPTSWHSFFVMGTTFPTVFAGFVQYADFTVIIWSCSGLTLHLEWTSHFGKKAVASHREILFYGIGWQN